MSETLTTLRDRVELILADITNVKWSTDALDEAITQALDAYSEHLPRRAIASLTLSAAGREVDISSLTYRSVERVWWDYTSTDPEYQPNWRVFEVWPGDILFINDSEEPSAADVVRVWYTTDHTLNGLDSATATTFPDRHASLVARGAVAFAALSRRVEILEQINDNPWAPRNLREWAEPALADFYLQLAELARRDAAEHSGWTPIRGVDRWDGDNVW